MALGPRRSLLLAALSLLSFGCKVEPGAPATGSTSPPPRATQVAFQAISEGSDVPGSTGLVIVTRNGQIVYRDRGRGFNVAAVDGQTGEIISVRNFDTWDDRDRGAAMRELLAHLEGLPIGALLLIAVGDEAGLNEFPPDDCVALRQAWVEDAFRALEQLGSRQIRSYCYRDSWAMAVLKGEGSARAEQLGKAQTVLVDIAITVP